MHPSYARVCVCARACVCYNRVMSWCVRLQRFINARRCWFERFRPFTRDAAGLFLSFSLFYPSESNAEAWTFPAGCWLCLLRNRTKSRTIIPSTSRTPHRLITLLAMSSERSYKAYYKAPGMRPKVLLTIRALRATCRPTFKPNKLFSFPFRVFFDLKWARSFQYGHG